jgi:hypothetical protein
MEEEKPSEVTLQELLDRLEKVGVRIDIYSIMNTNPKKEKEKEKEKEE